MSLSVGVEQSRDPIKERIEDWVGLQSVDYWDEGKLYLYDQHECKAIKTKNECDKLANNCHWVQDECTAAQAEKLKWRLSGTTSINSATSGRAFRLFTTFCIARGIRFTEEPDLPCNEYSCHVFRSLQGNKYVILLPSGTLGDVEEQTKDAWVNDSEFERMTNKAFTDQMVENVVSNKILEEISNEAGAEITVAGHSMGAVLAQKLCEKALNMGFLTNAPDKFFTGSGAYRWGFQPNRLRQRWFINEEDPFTQSVGTGHTGVEGLTVEQMRQKIENGEASIAEHAWAKYATQIKEELKYVV